MPNLKLLCECLLAQLCLPGECISTYPSRELFRRMAVQQLFGRSIAYLVDDNQCVAMRCCFQFSLSS
ncbi:hypothetical protein [Synechococcus sp. MIT S9504]|uniref:hypothetical protein n=1 Tax=Synechococcus sp. MIT S9504 TaxID=1801628 RepID=UPI0012E7E951|nr:hypothetical protein [Synechococcus sp. MIT S9504]